MIKQSDISFKKAQALINRWPLNQKFKLLKKLRKETWELELKEIFNNVDARRKKLKMSRRAILKEIQKGRREFYARHS